MHFFLEKLERVTRIYSIFATIGFPSFLVRGNRVYAANAVIPITLYNNRGGRWCYII